MVEQPQIHVNDYSRTVWYLPSRGKDHWHRLDGPAAEWIDGSKEWWVNGKRHRLDGPAVERVGGTKLWYVDDKLHRIDGPAVEWEDGTKEWYVDDKLHRIDGPAVEWENRTRKWCIYGNELPKKEVETWLEENDVDLKTPEGQMAFKLRWL